MLEQISQLVKQFGQQSVVENPDVPNELNNQVMAEATKTISGGLQNIVSGGGLQSLVNMFTGSQSQGSGSLLNNPITSMMVGNLANNLMQKLNLSPAVANAVSNNIIPSVLGTLTTRTASTAPQDNGFNLNSLISAFTGGASGGSGLDFQNLLNQFTHGNVAPNVAAQVAQQSQQHQQSGGLSDLIQGFFK
jgi:hypothetical protein